jgi:hypothetical protein
MITPATRDASNHAGYLSKVGGFRKNWLRRWFRIVDGGHELAYFANDDEDDKKGSIFLSGATDVRKSTCSGANRTELVPKTLFPSVKLVVVAPQRILKCMVRSGDRDAGSIMEAPCRRRGTAQRMAGFSGRRNHAS